MITVKPSLPATGLTYSQRRRLITLLWSFVSNSVLPFTLGFVFSTIAITYSFAETVQTFDKTGFGICVNR